jgi:transposase
MARPSKLTPEVSVGICRAIRAGNYPEIAARSVGIAASTFYRWMEQGRSAKSGIHSDFYEAVCRAEAESEVHAVANLRKAAPSQWRAALALLERRHGWSRREGGSPPQEERPVIDPRSLTERELKTLEAIYARAAE